MLTTFLLTKLTNFSYAKNPFRTLEGNQWLKNANSPPAFKPAGQPPS